MTLSNFKKKAKKIPDGPGVYFFLGPHKKILYIGKAASLRSRVRSYFSPDLLAARGRRIVTMVEKARSLQWQETDSVLEALIREANLIKTHKPRYNTNEKDDKSFKYVLIARENFPQVLLMRGKNLPAFKAENRKPKAVFGPFPHGLQLKEAMKIIRRIFPYRDEKCIAAEEMRAAGKTPRACFSRQIGLCPGVCTGEVPKKEYARTIRHLILFFQGKKKTLLRELVREMKRAAKEEDFEHAGQLRHQLFALEHIKDVSLIKEEYRAPSLGQSASNSFRIEAYDVAHLRGSAAVGVMAVIEDGAPQKTEYRTFHLRSTKAGDDPGGLREILSRRLAHSEWRYPRLIVVDGSTAQMNAAQKVLREHGMQVPIVGVVKNEKHQPRGIKASSELAHELMKEREQEILLVNAEAHRFAIGRHRLKLRSQL